MRTYNRSKAHAERAGVIPGRSLTRSKAPGRYAPFGTGPHYAREGHGCILRDIDGHDYIDMVAALGAISLGYGECAIAARDQLDLLGGGLFSLPVGAEVEAAEAVIATVAPWATRVRFTKTGSEATHAAYRIAKLLVNQNSG